MIEQIVGRYRIVAKLGEGAMGSVWRAEDPILRRAVAIKFLPADLAASSEARDRFLRDARAASALHHPGIATIYDADGRVYLALQLVDGETLGARIARAPLSIREAVRIIHQAADALGHAHRHGILHRDITSGNIMVTPEGTVVVVDFGLALSLAGTRLTRTQTIVGTAAYLAPEVAMGETGDERSDLYGLGVRSRDQLAARY